jgi:hypothetical protein
MNVDSDGWPTVAAVLARTAVLGDAVELSAAQSAEAADILTEVITQFQSPAPTGTGRRFTPVTETRTFDGSGLPEMRVPEMVPGAPFTVFVYETPVTDVVQRADYRGLGVTVLARPFSCAGSGFFAPALGDFSPQAIDGVFPAGKQNIIVSATWGYAAQVPADVAMAVAGEAAARVMIEVVGGSGGIPSVLRSRTTEVQQGNTPLAQTTSAITAWRSIYRDCVRRYRDTGLWKLAAIAGRMV